MEKERYENFKPSKLQKIVWFFWPTMTYMKWLQYTDRFDYTITPK